MRLDVISESKKGAVNVTAKRGLATLMILSHIDHLKKELMTCQKGCMTFGILIL
jgi:hypothetical protein